MRHTAALFQDPILGLWAGDALPQAVALHSGCSHLAGFDGWIQKAATAPGLSPALSSPVASKRSLNAKNLETLGAAALAELLIEVSGGNALVQRRLRLALAAAEGIDAAVQEVRKRLTAIDRESTFVDAAKRQALVSDLEAQLQAITGPIAADDPSRPAICCCVSLSFPRVCWSAAPTALAR